MKFIAKALLRAAFAILAAVPAAQAAGYPAKPITLIIGFTAGGPTDIVGRYLASNLEKELGQTVVVENRAGANGVVALQAAKRAAADGYTLMLGSSGTLSIEPVYKKRVDYDVLKDFTPVGLVASYPYLLVVPYDSPFTSVSELIQGAREKAEGLSFASAGSGAVNHLAGEWFKSATKTEIVHVPYKGDSAAIADLVGGRVDMAFLSVIAADPQIKAGKLRALAIAAKQPLSVAPGVPTVEHEAGISGFSAEPWNGILAPAGLPGDITRKLNAAINKIMSTDEAKAKLLTLGQYPLTGTPQDFSNHIAMQAAHWSQVIAAAHIEKAE
ncbi:Bug family tripartite tricarboxylate transporter substrate binding protein [Pollutimonas bauzanensis]|uniref:Tripartite-type tricarboxylate transporter, receptor component TctC n=1 Tax=Pollutimonas bauzanensis TaxID=658167 RepID=A0A1M5QVQ6_9BURK|nr:tripartite tricarboxylate transporter substrate binding protein [Pollutimonas bauzanensis]SHH17820.1 Tripartite-type tricarboxylate transporter, receptor component TctC [Pollutimonas bauzanensis]